MLRFLLKYRLPLLALILLAVAGWMLCHHPLPLPPLSPRAEDVVRATITRDQSQAGQDSAGSHRAAANAAANYEAGQAYAGLGKILHQQSKPHAKPIAADTDAVRLQKLLSAY